MKFFLILLANIIYINTQSCNLTTPKTKDDCNIKSVQDKELCCYLYAPNLKNNAQVCNSLPWNSYSGDKTYFINGNTYFIDCGVTRQQEVLPTCGPKEPGSKKQCMTGSSFTNSCCYHEESNNCYWLGTKFEGETTWAGLKLQCTGYYVQISVVMLLAFISMLL
jgi:hypothetical protein